MKSIAIGLILMCIGSGFGVYAATHTNAGFVLYVPTIVGISAAIGGFIFSRKGE
ncbi:MAG: hypothetical protein ACM3UU_04380 [Ignavibacteriales bacterium]